jgi:ABC-2 type transport system permease protein
MTGALRYLLARSFLNSLLARLRRLRQPKYLIGAILGAAYFYFYFYKFLFGGDFIKGPQMVSDALWPHVSAAMLLVAMILFSWIIPASRASVQFTEAEIAFLFPAPIKRRTLIIHKLIKSQLALLIIAVIMTLITGRYRAGSEAWFRMAGWWTILNTLNLHRIGASFALQRLREAGMTDWKRRLGVVLAIAGVVSTVVVLRDSLPPPPTSPAPGKMPDFGAWGVQIAQSQPLATILAPFRWIVAPYFARDLLSFVVAFAPAAGILLLHFLWVIRADVSFEEASIAAAQKRAALLSAHSKGEFRARSPKARTPVWQLRAAGFAPWGFLWKAMIKFGGRRAMFLWLLLFAILLGASAAVREQLTPRPRGGHCRARRVLHHALDQPDHGGPARVRTVTAGHGLV